MSQQQVGAAVGTPPGDTFADDSIAEYLKSHPEFFERHPLLLLSLKLPHRTGGAAISLVERQVSVLRQRNSQLERQFKDLVSVAKQNDALVEKIHQLALKLMRGATLPARLEQLETSLREDFAAERAVLVLFPSAPATAVREGFVKRLAPDDGDVRPYAAFVPVGADAALGFLIIGSRDADHFHPGKRMDFLARLGDLLAVSLSREQL